MFVNVVVDVFSKGCVWGRTKNEARASVKMHDNELGQTRKNRKVNSLNTGKNESRHTRSVIIFPRFMKNNALIGISEDL